MGFIDLSGSLGRHFGSIGVALNEISTCLTIETAAQRSISGPLAQRAESCLKHFSQAFNVSDQLKVVIDSAIPEHVGLGSGTQMSLAIGSALNAYYDLGLSVREIAAVMDRGLRSGIGIGVFEEGGLVVDGGRGEQTITPPIIVRLPIRQHGASSLCLTLANKGCMDTWKYRLSKRCRRSRRPRLRVSVICC